MQMFQELQAAKVDPDVDYTRRGMEKLVSEASRAAAFAARASAIQAQARLIRRQFERNLDECKYEHQAKYDEIVIRLANLHPTLSWEERASHYRVKTVDTAIKVRRAETALAEATAIIEAIEILVRSIQRARYDLSALMEGLKFAERLGETI
jgi:hypothetical protein